MSPRPSGFTLIEVVIAITLSAVVAAFIANFIAVPVQSHLAQSRRSELQTSAETVTHWMSQDVQHALPNSLRVATIGGRPVVEMIGIVTVTTYRRDTLDISAPDDQFDIMGLPSAAATGVVINNLGTAGHDAYAAVNDVVAAAQANPLSSTITVNPAFRFGSHPASQRAFLITPAAAVIRYECDVATGTLRRYDALALPAALVALPAGTPSQVIARDVTACTFTPAASTSEHGGLLLIRLTISRVTNGATDRLLITKQLKVEEIA